jgi:hypothetical protein
MTVIFSTVKKAFLLLSLIYLVYLIKTALGINILDKYSAPRFIKYPLIAADCAVDLKINFCRKALK